MKNYYRIIGVKKDASEEEIREHWVQLMRKLHPDQKMEGAMEDERIKEINEAYQVLKHSSTRVEYDLKRAYDQEKSRFHFSTLSIPICIFILLVAVGALYLKKSQFSIQTVLTALNKTNQMNQKGQIDRKDERDPAEQIPASTHSRILASTHPRINPIASKTRKPERSDVRNDNNVLNDLTINASTHVRIDESTPPPVATINPIVSATQQPERSSVHNDNNVLNDLTINASTHIRIDESTPPPVATINPIVSATQQPERSSVHNDNNVLNDLTINASTPLIATEEDVRHFFANYTERYTRKDLDGFLSLFSPRVVQNRQDGLEGIRKIYGNFFKQSQDIEYHLSEIKIEIYQNGVEVKARYELVQLLKKSGEKKIWRGDIRWTLVKEDGALKILSLDYQPQKSY
jgi:hypothetical protein